jgi:hypothetical protein
VELDIQPSGKYQVFKGFSVVRFVGNPSRDQVAIVGAGGPTVGPGPGPPLANDVPILLNEGDVMIRWKQVPAEGIPVTAIANSIGKTNLYDFGIPPGVVGGTIGCYFRKGTLLMLYPRYRVYRMINGLFAYDIDFRFKHYPFGANSFYRVTSIPRASVNSTNNGLVASPGIAGQLTSVVSGGAGNDLLVNTPGNHGLAPGDNVNLLNGLTVVGGPFQVGLQVLTGAQFSLNFTEKTPAESIPTVTGWVLSPGFYPASRDGNPLSGFGSTNLLTMAGDNPLFGPTDYTLLFQPEP